MGVVHWIVDGNNVMGAGADGWWNDPPAAAARLAQQVAEWCRTHDDDVTLVFDGRPVADVGAKAGGRLAVEFAPRPGRDAADDRIVELAEELFVDPELRVVTSDKGLVARLPPGVEVVGSGAFRRGPLGLSR
jgi:predicted RNA-binding protein with PIN domain